MTKLTLGQTRLLPIDNIHPYWRNPRRVPEEAVNALKESLTAYGYQQPIVVDAENVIVIGHTRYAAMRSLNFTEVPVIVANLPAAKISQLRVIDNRTSEFSSWDFDALVEELEVFDEGLLNVLFPEVTMTRQDIAHQRYEDDVEKMEQEWQKVVPEVGFVCPACFHTWEMTVTRDDVFAGRIEMKKETP